MRALLIDDDRELARLLGDYLGAHGVELAAVEDGPAGIARLQAGEEFDIVLLDVMLPGIDGFEVCRRIRTSSAVPIVMLTARGQDDDRVVGLDLGADDYVPKPFNPRELLARIHAVLRRRPRSNARLRTAAKVVRFGPFERNLETRLLTREGERMSLTGMEYSLLRAFAMHPGEPLSRERLSQIAFERELGGSARSLDVQVSRLRRLLGDEAQRPRLIQTVWGYGYAFMPDGQPHR